MQLYLQTSMSAQIFSCRWSFNAISCSWFASSLLMLLILQRTSKTAYCFSSFVHSTICIYLMGRYSIGTLPPRGLAFHPSVIQSRQPCAANKMLGTCDNSGLSNYLASAAFFSWKRNISKWVILQFLQTWSFTPLIVFGSFKKLNSSKSFRFRT